MLNPPAVNNSGGEAHFGIHHTVVGEVLGTFSRHPANRVLGLHDRQGVLERLQIPDQGSAVGGIDEPLTQLLGVGGGQSVVTAGSGEVDDGLRSQAAVEVVVQQDLGQCADLVEVHT